MGREEAGVGGAQEGPVGKAEVVQPLLAERLAKDVHVARRVLGVDVGQELGRTRFALLRHELRLGDDLVLLHLRLRVRVLRHEGVGLSVVEAPDRRALPDAARVEAHDVVLREQRLVEHLGGREREIGAAGAGAARVDDQRAQPAAGIAGRLANDREADGLARRMTVVQRYREASVCW